MAASVLLTGARGFVGRHLLAELGDRATATDADVTAAEEVGHAVAEARPQALVHLAARSSVGASWGEGAAVWSVNVVGTVNVLEAVAAGSAGARVLFTSTGEVYGAAPGPTPEDAPVRPLSPYGASKAAAEVACDRARRADGADVVVARAFAHAGPGQDERFAVGSWTRQIARLERAGGGVLRVGNLDARRDLTDVRDVCRAYALLLDRAVPAGTYNVASGRAHAMRDVVEILVSLASCPVTAEPDETLMRAADVPALCGDATRLREATGWEPRIPLETTLADALDHARELVRGEAAAV